MWQESEEGQPLRKGLTTGSCATACAVAAAQSLLAGEQLSRVAILLPKGQTVTLDVDCGTAQGDKVRCTTIKDAGDDPDVTHGARVGVELAKADHGVHFLAGEGVGTVTRPGLPLAVGEPAINPTPRKMISEHLQKIAGEYNYAGGFRVAISIEQGEALARKTMNPRLGIVGGLSILGTTGIVRPFSCGAWIASIRQGIDVAHANGIKHIAASTGNLSEAAIRDHYSLPDMALIEMGDFVGAVLKHLRKVPVPAVSICGGVGKISKLAAGHMDLHSRHASIDFERLAQIAAGLGASKSLMKNVRNANTSIEAIGACAEAGIDLPAALCRQALEQVEQRIGAARAEVWAIDRAGTMIAHAGVLS